jgi:hypothetical protein
MTRDDGALRELALLIEVLERVPGDASKDELLGALTRLRLLREQFGAWEPRLIEAARASGASWIQLAPALGVTSRQAAERRYLRLNPHNAEPGLNGEQRVQATRDQRAGDRAVVGWARDNAVDLRRLAAEVLALENLPRAMRTKVTDALAGSDTAALLAPLSAAAKQLSHEYPDLAGRISAVDVRTDAARLAGEHRRT